MTSIARTQVDGCGGYHRSLGRVGADWAETRTRIDEAASQIRPLMRQVAGETVQTALMALVGLCWRIDCREAVVHF
ncbi:MAG: hypothetical protein WBD41_11855 [Rhodococcus sp. (in: high G+C Gram-positive bacteria)]